MFANPVTFGTEQPAPTPSKRQNSGAYAAVSVWSAVLKFTAPQHRPYRGRDTA